MTNLSESVESLEAAISEYDTQTRALSAALDAVTATTAEADAIRDNTDGGMTIDVRAKRLAGLTAHLFILQADVEKLQRGVDLQRQQIAKDSDEVRSLLSCKVNETIYDKIREHVVGLKQQYDVSGFPIEQLAETHQSIVELKRVESGLGNYAMYDEAGKLEAVRNFRRDVLEKLG